MGMTCPVKGCHSEGWCIHKTIMVVMMMVVVVGVIAWLILK